MICPSPKFITALASVVCSLTIAGALWAQSTPPETQGGSAQGTPAPSGPPMHPVNGAFRLALELSALTALGFWGYEQGDGASGYALMIGVPLAAATTWGVFAVPNDPSRGGTPVVAVPGSVRLAIELGMFGFATFALADMDQKYLALGYGGATMVHYAISLDRVVWLLRQ